MFRSFPEFSETSKKSVPFGGSSNNFNRAFDDEVNFRDEFLATLPDTLANDVNKRSLIKNVNSLYRSKGTNKGHEIFFRIYLLLKGQMRGWTKKNLRVLNEFGLTRNSEKILNRFEKEAHNGNFFERLKYTMRSDVFRQTYLSNVALHFAILFAVRILPFKIPYFLRAIIPY